jgi:hypothetical protein
LTNSSVRPELSINLINPDLDFFQKIFLKTVTFFQILTLAYERAENPGTSMSRAGEKEMENY